MCLSWVLNILPDDQGYSWTSLECVISPINKIVVKSTLKSINLVCWGSGFSQLWLLQSIKGERVVCTYSNLPVIRLAVKWKFFSPLIQVPFISLSFLQRKKKNELHCHTNDCLDVHYLSGYSLCTKTVCVECNPGAVNTALTRPGSHPPSSPFSGRSFCADSIFLWMLLNRWLQSAVGENLWNKQMPPEITIKPVSIYAGKQHCTRKALFCYS